MTRPAVRPTEIAAVGRCFPSGLRGEPVTGDFYEVLALDDNRTLIAVGDVAGHGIDVTTRMETLRDGTRELAQQGHSVVEITSRLDVRQSERGPEELATLWLGVYDRTTSWLEYASAGHLPPVLVDVDRGASLLSEASAPPLGTGQVARHVQMDRVQVKAGALLVAYTDGLLERAHLDIEHQIELLRGIIDELYVPGLSELALEHFVEGVLRRLPTNPELAPDDVCILAVHWPLASRAG